MLTVTPYGLAECCICDAPATVAIRDDADSELLGYCADDAAAVKAEFPTVQAFALSPKEQS